MRFSEFAVFNEFLFHLGKNSNVFFFHSVFFTFLKLKHKLKMKDVIEHDSDIQEVAPTIRMERGRR